MNEFDIINTYFQPLTQGNVELNNDASILTVPNGYEIIVTSDTLNSGTHFMPDAAPNLIAHKALRVNISDIFAMGAQPLSYQLNIAFPEKPTKDWLNDFTQALLQDQNDFHVFCSGGDTTGIQGPLSISITMIGLVKTGTAWTRNGAKEGDDILMTGPIGDSWIGLQVLQDNLVTDDDAYFIDRYYKPSIAPITSSLIHAAIDVSDGLIADLGHIASASNLQAIINARNIPISNHAQKLDIPIESILTAGDDYTLVMAVPNGHTIKDTIKIGSFTKGPPGVIVYDGKGMFMPIQSSGWTHF